MRGASGLTPVVLWDGRALKCAFEETKKEFCRHVNESYQLNNSSMHLMEGDKFKDDRERISHANEKVLNVLREKNESMLTPALCSALNSETGVVFKAGVSCSGSQKEEPACKLGLAALCLAVEEQDGLALECAYEKEPKGKYICQKVEDAYIQNIEAEKALEGGTFKDDRERIHFTNQRVRDVLTKNETSEVKWALYIAVGSETNALFQLMVSCTGSQKEKPACQKGIEALCSAMEELLNAIMQLDGDEGIPYEEFLSLQLKGTKCCGKHCYLMGLKVLNALHSWLPDHIGSSTLTQIPNESESN
ncbi:hypothetical protein Q1695_003809 [Nippostrongylus brasiliensis]|nr:hypothetical protein Q1695_003809 [Nippostrongylus brasiliensis]